MWLSPRVPELSPTSGESAEARALQGEHLATQSSDVNWLVDVLWCLDMFGDVVTTQVQNLQLKAIESNWKSSHVATFLRFQEWESNGLGEPPAQLTMVAQCTEYVYTMWSHLIFSYFFKGIKGRANWRRIQPARHPQQLAQRTKKALSTLRSNFAFTGRNITDEPKNNANNIQYIASQCFIHTGDPEPKPLDVFDHRPTGL